MLLRDIGEIVIIQVTRSQDESWMTLDYIYQRLDVRGSNNSQLENPLNNDPNVYYFRSREAPFTGNEEVVGDYLLFEYTGHNEDMFLLEFETQSELEAKIIGGGGYTNPFTTFMFAIIKGEYHEYRITYLDEATGNRVIFNKWQQESYPHPFNKTFASPRLEWI